MTKELDTIFDALAKRLGVDPESAEAVALDTAKLQVQMLWLQQGPRPGNIVKIKRGKGNN